MWALEKLLGSPAPRSNTETRGISPTPAELDVLCAQLLLASARGDADAARALLVGGAEAACRGEFGTTPLHRAAEQGHTSVASLLLAAGAAVNGRDDAGDTPLLCACRMGRAKAARVLIAAGGDASLCNKQGSNSLDAALEAREMLGLAEVSELLLDRQREEAEAAAAEPFDPSPRGRTGSATPFDGPLPSSNADAASAGGVLPRLGRAGSCGAALGDGVGVGGGGGGGGGGEGGGGGGGGSAADLDARSTRLRLRRDEWALDRNYPNCHMCKDAFTIFNRRHHCRSCGLVFCDKCSSSSISLTTGVGHSIVRVRVCHSCSQLHAGSPDAPLLVLDARSPIETNEVC